MVLYRLGFGLQQFDWNRVDTDICMDMVNIDIPQKYTFAPSGEGTPHLTIHPEATIDLDSTNAFEGMLLA